MEEVCPTEDMFMALLDTLVSPYLPTHQTPPSLDQQQLLANQIHAVVILYNYYYRKHHPSLEYLSFTSCCKLAVIFKPMLLAYMKLMRLPDYNRVLDLDGQLSLTEQVIMGACKVSWALLALEDVPATLGWPISKVTVLLVDSTRENCLLLFDSITKGTWSAIERDLDFSAIKSTNEDALRQLAFRGIKEVAGIDYSDLEVLESHIVYSLNEEKTAAHFFIVQSLQSITEDHKVHVEDVIKSLQGPLVQKSSRGWMLTKVHQYFHLLPFSGIMSDWFFREQLSKPVTVNDKDTVTHCSNSTENQLKNEVVVDENIFHENICVSDAGNNEASDGSHDTTKQDINDECFHHLLVPEKVDGDEFYKDAFSNVKVNHLIKETDAMKIDKDVLPSDSILMENDKECSNSIIQKDKVDVDTSGSVKIIHSSMEIDSIEIDKYVSPNDMNLVALKTSSVTGITSKQSKVVESKNSRISSSSGDSGASGNRAVDSHQSNSINVENPTSNLPLNEDALQQATLKPLLKKREKLCLQRSSIEEELALCEKDIQTFINGDANDMDVKMQAVIDFCNYVKTNSTTESQDGPGLGPCQHLEDPITLHAKRKRSSVAILPMQHPCQELDIVCCMNSWMLPTYCVRSSRDGFHADVNIKGVDFALSEGSNLKTTPAEARASAAVKMMALLNRVFPKQ